MDVVKKLGKGIWDTIQEGEEPQNIELRDDKNMKVEEQGSKGSKPSKNNTVRQSKSVRTDEARSKRSFMLTEKAIQKLKYLKISMDDKELSAIVEEAINLYFDKNKKNIDLSMNSLIDEYNKVK